MIPWFTLEWAWSQACLLGLAHFVWQGLLLGVAAWLWCAGMRRARAEWRYGGLLAIMAVMALCVPFTAWWLYQPQDAAPLPEPAVVASVQSAPAILEAPAVVGTSPDAAQAIPEAKLQGIPVVGPAVLRETVWQRIIQAARAHPNWERYLWWAWHAGVGLSLLRVAFSLGFGLRLRRRSMPIKEAHVLAALGRQAEALGMAIAPPAAWCATTGVPIVIGILRPIILLPLSMSTGLTPAQLEMVLCHELAHVRRFDPIVNLLQRIVESLLFYHPAVWYVSRRIRQERELCCDDAVVRLHAQPGEYAASLVALAEQARHAAVATGLAAVNEPSDLRRRVVRLLAGPPPSQVHAYRGRALMLLAAIGLLAIAGRVYSQAPETAPEWVPVYRLKNPLPAAALEAFSQALTEKNIVFQRDDTKGMFLVHPDSREAARQQLESAPATQLMAHGAKSLELPEPPKVEPGAMLFPARDELRRLTEKASYIASVDISIVQGTNGLQPPRLLMLAETTGEEAAPDGNALVQRVTDVATNYDIAMEYRQAERPAPAGSPPKQRYGFILYARENTLTFNWSVLPGEVVGNELSVLQRISEGSNVERRLRKPIADFADVETCTRSHNNEQNLVFTLYPAVCRRLDEWSISLGHQDLWLVVHTLPGSTDGFTPRVLAKIAWSPGMRGGEFPCSFDLWESSRSLRQARLKVLEHLGLPSDGPWFLPPRTPKIEPRLSMYVAPLQGSPNTICLLRYGTETMPIWVPTSEIHRGNDQWIAERMELMRLEASSPNCLEVILTGQGFPAMVEIYSYMKVYPGTRVALAWDLRVIGVYTEEQVRSGRLKIEGLTPEMRQAILDDDQAQRQKYHLDEKPAPEPVATPEPSPSADQPAPTAEENNALSAQPKPRFQVRWVGDPAHPESGELLPVVNPAEVNAVNGTLFVLNEVLLSASDFECVRGMSDFVEALAVTNYCLVLIVKPDAAGRLYESTKQRLGQQFAVVLDGKVLCAPIVREAYKPSFAIPDISEAAFGTALEVLKAAGARISREPVPAPQPAPPAAQPAPTDTPAQNPSEAAGKLQEQTPVQEPNDTAAPWRDAFNQVYSLKDNEILKRIPPPFIPERMDWFRTEKPGEAAAWAQGPSYVVMEWDKQILGDTLPCPRCPQQTAGNLLRAVVPRASGYLEVSPEFDRLETSGDWVVRRGADSEAVLKEFVRIMRDELQCELQMERVKRECGVIVASGAYAYTPLHGEDENPAIHVYTEIFDPKAKADERGKMTVPQLLCLLEKETDLRVVDETVPYAGTTENVIVHPGYQLELAREKAKQENNYSALLPLQQIIIANVEKQTGIQLRIERRIVSLWRFTGFSQDNRYVARIDRPITPDSLPRFTPFASLDLALEREAVEPNGLKLLAQLPTLHRLYIGRSDLSTEILALLATFPVLQRLEFYDLSDDAMKQLPVIPSLRELVIQGKHAGFSPESFGNVARMTGLESLNLTGRYSDECIAQLKPLTALKSLELSSLFQDKDWIADAALAHIAAMPSIEILNLWTGSFTDEGLAALTSLPKLKRLFVPNAAFTNAGLVHMGKMSHLEELVIRATNMTDEGLAYLEPLSALKRIQVEFSEKISDESVVRLRDKIPSLKEVVFEPPRAAASTSNT